MTRKTKTVSMLSMALIGNVLYYILCAVLFQFSPASQTVHALFFAGSILLWFLVGMHYGKHARKAGIGKKFGFAFLAILPILLYLITYLILTRTQELTANPWLLFYSFGAPLLFWLKPAAFLLHHITLSFPVFAVGYIAMLMLVTFISATLFSPKREKVAATDLAQTPAEELPSSTASLAEAMSAVQETEEPFENEVVPEPVELSEEDKQAAESEHQEILRFIEDADSTEGPTIGQSTIEQQYEDSQYRIDGEGDTYKTMPMPTIDELYEEVLSQRGADLPDEATLYMQEIITDTQFIAEYDDADKDMPRVEDAETTTDTPPKMQGVGADEAVSEPIEAQPAEHTEPQSEAASVDSAKQDEGSKKSIFSAFLHKKKKD